MNKRNKKIYKFEKTLKETEHKGLPWMHRKKFFYYSVDKNMKYNKKINKQINQNKM